MGYVALQCLEKRLEKLTTLPDGHSKVRDRSGAPSE